MLSDPKLEPANYWGGGEANCADFSAVKTFWIPFFEKEVRVVFRF